METNLTLHVTGFESNVGQALLRLFRKEDKVPTKPFMTVKATIANKEASFVIDKLAFDDYAAIIVHDQNSNNDIDHSFGIPSEPLGFTNNWKLGLFTGMPTFEKLKFTFSKADNTFTVKMDH
jgi:uncharacterized protein (DUF2141 family)